MDDLIEALIGTGFGIALVVAFGALFAAGWLLYKFFEVVLIPFCAWLIDQVEEGCRRLGVWHHERTWRQRMQCTHDETITAIDALCEEQVLLAQQQMDVIEQQYEREQAQRAASAGRTTDGTAAVPSAVRSADRAA